jgi:S-DNA-T family DNA segregation ATPase FtsK/SpoIIIE
MGTSDSVGIATRQSGTAHRRLLELQADRIETVLARHKVPARVAGGTVTPRWVRFQVLPNLGARVSKVKGLAEELALALGCDTCRVARQGAFFSVEIPRWDPQPVRLLALQKRLFGTLAYATSGRASERVGRGAAGEGIPFGTAVLGLAEDGAPLLLRLPSPQVAHVLIAGTTGSGKSVLAKTIIASLALVHRPSQMGFILVDPKRRAFRSFSGLPHLFRPVLCEPEQTAHALEMLVQLMLDRDREGRVPASETQPGEPRIVVVIDELADLLMMTGKQTQDAITRLSQRGREAGIHLLACTQKPASQVIGSLAKANFPVRLVGRVTSPEDAKVATGYGGTGAEHLRGPGDFIAVHSGQLTHFQAAYISPRELAALVRAIAGTCASQTYRSPSGWVETISPANLLRAVASAGDPQQSGVEDERSSAASQTQVIGAAV